METKPAHHQPDSPAEGCIEVTVKYVCGAYQTQTVRGKRASSTMSATQAAQRLGRKLWGYEPELQELEYPAAPAMHPRTWCA